jgi:hypothetical protein
MNLAAVGEVKTPIRTDLHRVRSLTALWRLPKIPSVWRFLNPPKSPFFKGGLSKEINKFPPLEKGG